LGGGWIFSDENFFSNIYKVVSFGKLRANYGTTGSDGIGDYKHLSLYSQYGVVNSYQGTTSLEATGLPNPHLQWEETRKLDVGIDLGFFKDQRILLSVDYYRNRSSNQLLGYSLPYVTGFNNIASNFPATVQNTGWEFKVNSSNISTKNFTWVSSFNLSLPRNKLVAFPNIENTSYAISSLVVGQSLSNSRVYHFLGVDPNTGLYIVADAQGKPTSSPNYDTDANIYVDLNPNFVGGLKNSITYKSLTMELLFQFVKQKGTGMAFGSLPGQFGFNRGNQLTMLTDRWAKPGDKGVSFQRVSAGYPANVSDAYYAAIGSDAAYTDASYVRLKNVNLYWTLPLAWSKKIRSTNSRIYLHAQNILTFTKYTGLDPETLSISNLPPLRTITVGLQVSF